MLHLTLVFTFNLNNIVISFAYMIKLIYLRQFNFFVFLLLLIPYCSYFILYCCNNYLITVLLLSLLHFYTVTVLTLLTCKQLEIKHAINFLYFLSFLQKLWLLHVTSVTCSIAPVTEAWHPSQKRDARHRRATHDDRNSHVTLVTDPKGALLFFFLI